MVSGRVFFAFLVVALAVGCNGNHCFSYQFECDSGQCVENDYRCDREDDCYDGSDEDGCSGTCYSYQFECKSGQCVSPSSSECDGTDDCYDGSDEDGCASAASLAVGLSVFFFILFCVVIPIAIVLIYCCVFGPSPTHPRW
ncbi:SCO-spondin [Geodia barretti]|uniref:SCO-spondin n=1 Tax=Geodia barretti TaxID=519541 RepID=A0AA35SF63_GEOBA|nr:SCO-spondin [Geodia barretti]